MDTFRPTPVALPASRAWPTTLAVLGAYALWLIACYWDTVTSMVSIWYRSETFAHGFLVFPISAWLVWRERRKLARLAPVPALSPGPLVVLALAGAVWFAAELADVLAARHLAWITMLIAGVWMLTGNAVARRLVFPLGFLYFAVPIGEFLLPTLIEWTANFTVAALRASGVPVWREGMTFQIPTGAWSVVEACSGLRYLIASVTVGVLYAYLAYRSPLRRAAFVAASIVVPIIANWLRAYMIVMIGHLSGNRLAVGVDHIIYGWIFFGLVILLLFWVGSFWREDEPDADEPAREVQVSDTGNGAMSVRSLTALATALVITAIAPGATRLLHGYDFHGPIDSTPPAIVGWNTIPQRIVGWTPEFSPPRAAIDATYEKGAARTGIYVALYFDQDHESKLVSTANSLLRTTDKTGYVISERRRTVDVADGSMAVDETVLRLLDRRIVARRWYWVDGEFTASAVRAKLLQARARLAGRGDAGAIVVVYAPLASDTAAPPVSLDDVTREAAAALRPMLAQRFRRGAP